MALPTNIRLGWKGLPGTNALGYYEKSKLTAVKSITTLTSGRRFQIKVAAFQLCDEFKKSVERTDGIETGRQRRKHSAGEHRRLGGTEQAQK